jgi:hypothetical protein
MTGHVRFGRFALIIAMVILTVVLSRVGWTVGLWDGPL